MIHFNPIDFNKQNIKTDLLLSMSNSGENGSIWAVYNGSNNVSAEQRYNKNEVIIYDKKTNEPKIKIQKDENGNEYKYIGRNLDFLESISTYWPNGNIKEVYEYRRLGTAKTVYRQDGTIYSEEERQIDLIDLYTLESFNKASINSLIKYEKDGITPKSQLIYDFDTDEYTLYRYSNGRLGYVAHYDDSMKMTDSFIIDSNKYGDLSVEYENGKVVCCEKNLPDGVDDFNEAALNGEYDIPLKQGATATCYISAPCIALSLTPTGLSYLNQSVDYDEETGMGTSKFQRLGKEYTFSKEEIANAMSRLGLDEPDYVLSVLGYEKIKNENNNNVGNGKIYEYLKAILPPEIGVHAWQGVIMRAHLEEGLLYNLKEHDYVIVAATGPETVDTEWSDEKNKEKHFIPCHGYAVKEITPTRVIVIEPNSHTENEYTMDEFLEKFSQIAWAKLN